MLPSPKSSGCTVGGDMRFVALRAAIVAAAGLMIAQPHAAPNCDYHVSPVTIDVAAAGQTGTITVDTQPGCAWTASVKDAWISTDTLSGTGAGAIRYTAVSLRQSGLRQARIKVRWDAPTHGQDVTLTQQNGPCTLPGSGFIDVVPDGGGGWSRTTTDANWITMLPGTVVQEPSSRAFFTLAPNPGTQTRTAIIVNCRGRPVQTIRWTAADGRS